MRTSECCSSGLAVFIIALPVLALARSSLNGTGDQLKGAAAVNAALRDPRVQTAVTSAHYTRTRVLALDQHTARVTFYVGPRVVFEAAVDRNGTVSAIQLIAKGYIRAGSGYRSQSPFVLIALTLLFLLMFVTLPLASIRNLDLLALASTSLTIWVLQPAAVFELSIWLAIPPLVYLSLRCLRAGFGGFSAAAKERAPLVDKIMIKIGWEPATALRWAFGLAAVAAAMLCIPGGGTGDVGVASLSGATDLLRGTLPYGHIATDIVHGDTYPIFAYCAVRAGRVLYARARCL